jgi:hypothetical protein
MGSLERIEESVDRELAKKSKQKGVKKEYTTKMVIMPGINVFDAVKEGLVDVEYPLTFSFLSPIGGYSRYVKDRSQLKKALSDRDFHNQQLVRASRHDGKGTYFEFNNNGRVIFDKKLFENIRNMKELDYEESVDVCQYILNKKLPEKTA